MKVFDLIGVGVGPSNLALLAAIAEKGEINAKFFELRPSFAWHPNMLIDDAEMQVSFLKDIATMRNPQSPYTFINYLFTKNRLTKFINLKSFYPKRIEFNDYLAWIAGQLSQYIEYSSKVISVEPYGTRPFNLLKVKYLNTITGEDHIAITKNIVVAEGGKPKIPKFIDLEILGDNVWHSSEYLTKIKKIRQKNDKERHFCVVGGGQSAAEIVYDLYKLFPTSKISFVHRNFGLRPVDDSSFVNEIFDQTTVDLLFNLGSDKRLEIINAHKYTNYSAIDIELLEKLYHVQYEEKVTGEQKLFINGFSSLVGVVKQYDKLLLEIEQKFNSTSVFLEADTLILATGYYYSNPPDSLSTLNQYINRDENGRVLMTKEYRLITNEDINCHIYTQGCNEMTHGLSDTLLSLSAVRAKVILEQIENLSSTNLHLKKVNVYGV